MELNLARTPIPGLLLLDLPVHGDARGWFKENWQREKMVALGLPDFGPVQNNVSFNAAAGATRGLHAEPWDKLVSVATGRVFGAWADLREGPGFGRVFTLELGPDRAVFVPRGVANSYQALADGTAYSYLVNEHWSAAAREGYGFVNLADQTLGIEWPIPLDRAEISEADRHHPPLADVVAMPPKRTLVVGSGGQLGAALMRLLPGAIGAQRPEFDLTDPATFDWIDWGTIDTIINAGAYTAVDAAETPEGRLESWAVNVAGVARLVEIARRHRIRLVQVSSDYVFDGAAAEHDEDDPVAPLGVYGQTKAAGDALVATLARHYTVRTSWVVGAGPNFIRTMAGLADRGANPTVVADQEGRLTFADDLAAGILHLLGTDAPFGTYNLTNAGPVTSWADIAAEVFRLRGRDPAAVSRVTTEEYGRGRQLAPRPRHSALNLDRIRAAGFDPPEASPRLVEYLASMD